MGKTKTFATAKIKISQTWKWVPDGGRWHPAVAHSPWATVGRQVGGGCLKCKAGLGSGSQYCWQTTLHFSPPPPLFAWASCTCFLFTFPAKNTELRSALSMQWPVPDTENRETYCYVHWTHWQRLGWRSESGFVVVIRQNLANHNKSQKIILCTETLVLEKPKEGIPCEESRL